MIIYAVVDDSLSPTFPLGDALEVFIRREDAERFIEEVCGDDPERASYLRIEERELRCTQLFMILARVKPSRHWSGRPDLLHNLIFRRVSHNDLDAHNEVTRGDHEVGRHLADFFVIADCQRDKGGAIRHAFASVLSGLGRVAASFLGSFVLLPAERLIHGSSPLPLRERSVDAHANAPIEPGEVVLVPFG